MIDRRQLLIGTAATTAALAVPSIVAAHPVEPVLVEPVEFGASPLFAETTHRLSFERGELRPTDPVIEACFWMNGTYGPPNAYRPLRIAARRIDDDPGILVTSAADAENLFFNMVPFTDYNHMGVHRILAACMICAVACNRGFANHLFGDAAIIERFGFIAGERAGRWTTYHLPDGHYLHGVQKFHGGPPIFVAPGRLGEITVYGSSESGLGTDLVCAYARNKIDAPGMIRVNPDGSRSLVLQPEPKPAVLYAKRFRAPDNILSAAQIQGQV